MLNSFGEKGLFKKRVTGTHAPQQQQQQQQRFTHRF
jgi:hypothetical protein